MKTAIVVLVVALFVVGIPAFVAYVVQAYREDQVARALRETGVSPTDAAPAPEPPAQGPERARHTPEALRVHTCENCRKGRTYKPGDWCEACVREYLSQPAGGAA
jgi:hypothetical protein